LNGRNIFAPDAKLVLIFPFYFIFFEIDFPLLWMFVFLLFVPKFCRIHYIGADGYTSSEVIGSENPGMIYDEIVGWF
jgi:hypothetical protein